MTKRGAFWLRAMWMIACSVWAASCDDTTPVAPGPSAPTGSAHTPATRSAAAADSQVEQKVLKIVAEQMGVKQDELKLTTRMREDLKADDLDDVELVMEIEDEFNLSIPDEDAEKFKTVGDVVAYIRLKTPAAKVAQ